MTKEEKKAYEGKTKSRSFADNSTDGYSQRILNSLHGCSDKWNPIRKDVIESEMRLHANIPEDRTMGFDRTLTDLRKSFVAQNFVADEGLLDLMFGFTEGSPCRRPFGFESLQFYNLVFGL